MTPMSARVQARRLHPPAAPGAGRVAWAVALPIIGVLGVLLFRLAQTAAPPSSSLLTLAGYATALEERSDAQRYNAALAAETLNGYTIAPGAEFSFNRVVKPWTIEHGYVKAPVSYDGEMVLDYGGGICQTSTTLYNAALLAGLPILERHPHVFAPRYVTPGRDAAVAQYTVDLRFRNPYPWPVRLQVSARGGRVEVRILARTRPALTADVTTSVVAISPPGRVVRFVPAGADGVHGATAAPGSTGFRVITTRLFYRGGEEVRREVVSDDTYAPADRVVRLPEN